MPTAVRACRYKGHSTSSKQMHAAVTSLTDVNSDTPPKGVTQMHAALPHLFANQHNVSPPALDATTSRKLQPEQQKSIGCGSEGRAVNQHSAHGVAQLLR